LLNYYNGSRINALVALYPEIKENLLQFKEWWKFPENQRNYLDTFAKSQKFNPLDAENWYSVTHIEIIRAGGRGLLNYYNRSHIKALVQLYPELMLKTENFLKFKGNNSHKTQYKVPGKK